jgi:hypothetical protein
MLKTIFKNKWIITINRDSNIYPDFVHNFIPPIWEKELSREELFSLLKQAYKSFYFRPKYVFKKIFQLRSPKELLAKTRAALRLLKLR